MPTTRSYGDACGIARALDVIGERWALLVVRELLLGPLRFTDLRRALPNASTNLVADRLRELAARGVVRRRSLPPPAGTRVYELTDWGRELEPIILALGDWGVRGTRPPAPASLSATSALLALRRYARPGPDAPASTVRIELDQYVWTARAARGRVRVVSGDPVDADASLRTDPGTLGTVLGDPEGLDAAVSEGRLVIGGDSGAVRRLLLAVAFPSPVSP